MNLEGELRELDLIEKLIELSDAHFTGAIKFENDADGIIKIVYFKDGNVLSASSNDRADSIDEILLKSSKVSREHIKQALAKRKESESLGDALLGLGFITKKELAWVRRVQLIGIIRSLERWTEGMYTIVADYLPKREEGTIFNLPQIIVEVIVTEQDRASIEASLGGGDTVLERAPKADERYRSLGLNEDADRIFARIDGRSSAAEIAASSDMDAFSVFKLLYAFRILKVVQPAQKVQVKDELFAPLPELPSFDEQAPTEALPKLDFGADDSFMPDWDAKPGPAKNPTPAPASPIPQRPILSGPAPKSSSRLPLFVLLGLLLVGGAYGGYRYWKASKEQQVSALPTPAQPRPKPLQVPPTATSSTVASTNLTSTATVATTTAPHPTTTALTTTATSAPLTTTHPVQVIAPPPTSTAVASKPPVVIPTKPPVPVAVPTSSDPERARYDQLASRFRSESSSIQYSVQVAFLCQTSSLKNAMQSGGNSVWFVPATSQGRSCFRVFFGRYQSRAEAQNGLGTLPANLRDSKPVVVHVPEVIGK